MKSLFKKIVLPSMISAGFSLSMSCRTEAELKSDTAKPESKEEADNPKRMNFKLYTLNAMEVVKSPLSKLKRDVHADLIVQIAEKRIKTDEGRKYWIATLGRESRFFQGAKSSVGAIGIGQIMPKFGKDFAKACGYEDFRQDDVNDLMVNLNISACFFQSLSDQHGGLVQLALASYNAGVNSPSLKNYKNLGSMAQETANYVSSIWLIASLAEQKLTPILSFQLETVAKNEVIAFPLAAEFR